MSNKKISDLELVTANASGDEFPLVQNGETMKTTLSKIATYLGTIFTTTAAVAAQITAAITGKEDTANKQNNLTADGTNTKYPTVTATNTGLGTKLSLTGGTMSGNINMDGAKVRGLGEPNDDNDAATKIYTDAAVTGKENVSNKQNSLAPDVTNTKYPTVTAVNTGLATKLNLTGGTVTGGGGYTYELLDEGFVVTQGTSIVNISNSGINIQGAGTQLSFPDSTIQTTAGLPLTGGTMSGAIAMGTSKITGLGNPIGNQDAATKFYVDGLVSKVQLEYQLTNTATGTTSVTINATSGVATFTQVLGRKSNAYYEINNTSIAAGDFIECNLFYTGAGFPILMHYQTISNRIRLHIGNVAVDGGAGTDTNADLVVTFRKI
jgi:hypothetical protein